MVQFFQSGPKSCHSGFYLKIDIAQKVCQQLGIFCKNFLSPKPFKMAQSGHIGYVLSLSEWAEHDDVSGANHSS